MRVAAADPLSDLDGPHSPGYNPGFRVTVHFSDGARLTGSMVNHPDGNTGTFADELLEIAW